MPNQLIKEIILDGSNEDRLALFAFDVTDSTEKIYKKFRYFTRTLYTRYFKTKDAPFHKKMICDYIESYKGNGNFVEAASRDTAKTSLAKLFLSYVFLNDTDAFRRYVKVLSKDLANSKQIVTDVYNMMVEAQWLYGDVFEKEGKTKREETQGSFTMKKGVKVSAGTVGQDQRGHLQDAFRPDWLVFEDIEDRGSISSQAVTQKIILKCQEAIDGMSSDGVGGNYVVNCNYISEDGTIQWFMDKESTTVRIIPIATDIQYGVDEKGKKTLKQATPTWTARFTFEDLVKKYKDAEDWYGEFLCDPARSDDKFFDIDIIDTHIKNYAKEPVRQSAGVKYWDAYKPNHRYGQGSDHSEGIGKDSNTLTGINFTTGEIVYTYASNTISPELSAEEFARVGGEFGNCIYAPETNNRCGGIVIQTLKNRDYPNIYQLEVKDKVGNILTNKLGWDTNKKTKNTMFMEFRRDFEDGLIKIYDIDLLKEMRSYSNNDLTEKTTGLITRHFDSLISAVIAWQMRDHATYQNTESQFVDDMELDDAM